MAVVAYFERIKESFSEDAISGLSKYGDVTVKTKIKHISSYKIMQDFQLMERELLLTDMIKIRKKENGFNIKKHL